MMFNNYSNAFSSFPMYGIGLGYFTVGAILFFILMAIVVAIKGYALWHASKRNDKGWFVAILIVNTFGILELIYLYYIVGKWRNTETKSPPPPNAQ